MLVHSVFFWLKPNIPAEKVKAFREGLESLRAIETAHALYVGTAVPSDRPVVDSSYSFGLTVIFNNAVGLETYQVHPLHKEFLQKFSSFWDKVLVYDAQ